MMGIHRGWTVESVCIATSLVVVFITADQPSTAAEHPKYREAIIMINKGVGVPVEQINPGCCLWRRSKGEGACRADQPKGLVSRGDQ